jgi:hypothetical protein
MLSDHSNAKKRRVPKRKSCTECIKAKRRCDQGILACVRCVKQKLECRYISYPSAEVISSPNEESSRMPEQDKALEWSQLSSALTTENFGVLDHTQGGDNYTRLSSGGFLALEDSLGLNQDLMCFNLPSPHVPSSLLSHIPGGSSSIVPSSSGLPSFAASRLDYGAVQLKLAPSMMVHQNKTLWSHPLLFEEHMPRSMHGKSLKRKKFLFSTH